MNGLQNFLSRNNINIHEGYSQQVEEQINMLYKIASQKSVKYACEIGFNAGHSAEIILQSNADCILISFDLGYHQDYLYWGKYYIDQTFPNRHHLIIGDSTEMIPKFIKDHPTLVFDFIFIDGGHAYDVAIKDFYNCHHLSHSETLFMIDDTFFPLDPQSYTYGPTKTLLKAYDEKIINTRYGHFQNLDGRGFSWGTYKGKKKQILWEITDIMYEYQFYYGTDKNKKNISHFVYDHCWNKIMIPKDKNKLFGDPCVGIEKEIYYKNHRYSESEIINIDYDENLNIQYGTKDKNIPIEQFLKKNCVVEILLDSNKYDLFKENKEEQCIYIINKTETYKFSEKSKIIINLITNQIVTID